MTVRVRKEFLERIKNTAEKLGKSVEEFIREAIYLYIKYLSEEEKQKPKK